MPFRGIPYRHATAPSTMDCSIRNRDCVHCCGRSANGNTRRNSNNAEFRFLATEATPHVRHLSASVWFVIVIGLCCGSLHALGHERIRKTEEPTADQVASVGRTIHKDTSRQSTENYEPTLSYPADAHTQPASQSNPGSAVALVASLNDESDEFQVSKRSAVHNVVMAHTMSDQSTGESASIYAAEPQDTLGGRKQFLLAGQPTFTSIDSAECGQSSAVTANECYPSEISGRDTSSAHYASSLKPCSARVSCATRIDTSGGVSARETTLECNSILFSFEKSDRTRGVLSQPHSPSLPARDGLEETYQYDQQQNQHEFFTHNSQSEQQTELKQNSKSLYIPQLRGNSPAETFVPGVYLNSREAARALPTVARDYYQAAHVTRSLAADALYNSPLTAAETGKDAQQLVTSATGNGNAAEGEKEAMALLSGVRGRRSGVRQRVHPGTPVVTPGTLPYYYNTLTPQQIQVLTAQQYFQSHPSVQYHRQQQLPMWESEAQQEQQQQPEFLSQLQQTQQQQQQREQEQQYHQQRAMIPPPYNAPQQTVSGTHARSGGVRRFSREGLTPRQRHRLQRQLPPQYFHQPWQFPQQHFTNGFVPNAAYFRGVPFNGAASPAGVAPAAGSHYTPLNDAYTGSSTVNASHLLSPQDPNLLPLQYSQQRTERERLEAQLRNQHDAWRAREQSSV